MVASACTPTAPGGAPTGLVSVQGGVKAVATPDVELALQYSPGVTQVRLANGTDPSGAAWQPIGFAMDWTLTPGDGEKVVSAQFSDSEGRVSSIALARVTLDTTPPQLDVLNATDGETIDITDGSLFALEGTATDAGVGVDAVVVSAGGSFRAAARMGDGWAQPIGAPSSGTSTYVVTATDLVGNEASTPLNLTVLVPAADGENLLRPSVMVLDGSLRAGLVDVGTHDDLLVFTGDQSGVLSEKRSVIAPPGSGLADQGLMRLIDSVSFDAGSNRTVVETSPASLPDVFARLSIATTEAVGAAPGVSGFEAKEAIDESECDSFRQGKLLSTALPLLDGDPIQVTPPGLSPWSLDVSVGLEAAAYFDANIEIVAGWFSVDIPVFDVSGGLLLCLDAGIHTDATTATVLGQNELVPFDEWDRTVSLEVLNGIGISTPNILESITMPIPVPVLGPVLSIRPSIVVSGTVEFKPSTSLGLTTRLAAGGRVGINLAGPYVEPLNSSDMPQVDVDGTAQLRVPVGYDVGFEIGDVAGFSDAGADFFSVGLTPYVEAAAEWQSSLVGPTGVKLRTSAKACVDFEYWVGGSLSISVGIPHVGPRVDLTLFEITAASDTIEIACKSFGPWIYDSAQILTDELPPAVAGLPYEFQLEATEVAEWSIVAGGFAPGLTLSESGLISGTPTVIGSDLVRIRAEFPSGGSREVEVELHVVSSGLRFVFRNPYFFGPSGQYLSLGDRPSFAARPDEAMSVVMRVRRPDWMFDGDASYPGFLASGTGWSLTHAGRPSSAAPLLTFDVPGVGSVSVSYSEMGLVDDEWIWVRASHDPDAGILSIDRAYEEGEWSNVESVDTVADRPEIGTSRIRVGGEGGNFWSGRYAFDGDISHFRLEIAGQLRADAGLEAVENSDVTEWVSPQTGLGVSRKGGSLVPI